MVRVLGKYRKECVEAVWKSKPKSAPEAVAAMRGWEHQNGHPAKVWTKRFDGQHDKKVESSPQSLMKTEPTPAVVGGGVQVNVEKPWSHQRYGGAHRSVFKYYKCGESGHMLRDCPKTTVKKVDVHSEEEDADVLLMEGTVNGKKAL